MPLPSPSSHPPAPSGRPSQRRTTALLLGGIGLFTAAAWTVLVVVIAPQHLHIGTTVFGLGLGVTAYTLGVRHAFDADHIAAIDNTTRRLMGEDRPAASVGFWFALGHSSVVVVLAAGIAGGVRFVVGLTDGSSAARSDLGVVSTGVSGLFLYLIGLLNLVAFVGVVRLYRRARAGAFDSTALDRAWTAAGWSTGCSGRCCARCGTRPRCGWSDCCSASGSTPPPR